MEASSITGFATARGTGGECAELLAVLECHQDRLYNYLLSMLMDSDDAQDCLQDTFLRAYEQSLRGSGISGPWLYTVARHRAVDVLRSRGKVQRAPADLTEVCDSWWDDRSQQAHDLLSILPAQEREVLYLFDVDGFSGEEISRLLGIRPGAVRARIFRARERVRCCQRQSTTSREE